MKGATLFSGIDAPEVSAPGIEWLWRAEIDKFANAVSEYHRDVPNIGDVSAPDFVERALEHGRPDIVVFGSPCQSFSVAGKRLGLDDPRGNLALVALDVVRRIRPAWIVFENVPGLLSSDEGADFEAFLGTVEECGYLGCWRILDAQHSGVPQRRRRVFFVGYLGDWRPAAAVLFERESLRWNTAPRRGEGARVAALTANGVGTCGADDNQGQAGHLIAFGGNNTGGPIDVATAVNAHGGPAGRMDFESETFVTHSLTGEGFDASEDGTGRGTPIVPISFKDHGADVGDTSPTLRAMGHDGSHANAGGQVAVAIQERAVSENLENGPGGKGWQKDTAYTLEARNKAQAVAVDIYNQTIGGEVSATVNAASGMPNTSGPKVMAGMQVRRITPVEAERLQGFPDNHTRIPWRGKPAEKCPDGPRYKAIGNSMAVPVIGWILDRVQKVEAIL